MAEVSDAILKRIRALLAMSRGNANEHEAAVAANKAAELLAQFNLSEADVSDKSGRVIEDGDLMTSSSNPWRRDLALACARLYFCDYYWQHVRFDAPHRKRPYIRGDKHNFIGLPHNVVVAKEMFVYLVDTVERLAKEARKASSKAVVGPLNMYEHAFRSACGTRVKDRLWQRYYEQTEPPKGLLTKSNLPALYTQLSAQVSDFMEKNHTDLMVRPNRGKLSSWAGAIDGKRAGDKIGLDTQVGSDELKRLA